MIMDALVKSKFILALCLIIYSQFTCATKLVFNIEHNIINKAIFDNSFDNENGRNYIQLFNNNNFIETIPSFDEDGGNRFDKIITRYDGNNIMRIITVFPDRGYFNIFYDIGLEGNNKSFILNRVSFAFVEWVSDEKIYSRYCYIDTNINLEKLEKNSNWFYSIRPTINGWENGSISGDCTELDNEFNFENAYQVISKSYFYDKPCMDSHKNIYLIKGDMVNVLRSQNSFYEVEYITSKNKIIKKWLHCSAIDACIE